MPSEESGRSKQDSEDTTTGSFVSQAAASISTRQSTPSVNANVSESVSLAQSHALFDSRNVHISGGQFNNTLGHHTSFVVHINQGNPADSESNSPPLNLNQTHNINPVQFSDQSSQENHEMNQSQVSSQSQEISSQKPNDIYERHLTLKERGFPLWIPDPNQNLHLDYRRTGIRIGDVGIITHSGAFSFLFNICLPHNDPVNPWMLPEHFAPISPPILPSDIEKFRVFKNGSHLASASVKISQSGSSISDIFFESSASEGAILTMPRGARSEDLGEIATFREYTAANVANWYRYVNGPRGREAKNGELRLVVGFDKTTSWGIATFANQTQQNNCCRRLKFGPSEGDSASTSYTWSQLEYSGVADVKAGPDSDEVDELRIDTDPSHVQFENQCIFVRTLNATLADDVWEDIHSISGSIPVNSRNSQYPRAKNYSNANRPHWNNPGNGSDISPSQGTQAGTQRTLQNVDITPDENPPIFVSGPVESIASTAHPSKALNDALLAKIPTAKMVITHDGDWSFQYDTLLNPRELVANILASRDICEENGVVFLEPKKLINEIQYSTSMDHAQVTDAAVVQLEDPALYRLPIIEQTRITVQVGLHAAIISLILILCVTQCINQGMDDILVLFICQGLMAIIDGRINVQEISVYLYSLFTVTVVNFTAIAALFLIQPQLNALLVLPVPATASPPPPTHKRKSKTKRDRKPAVIEDPVLLVTTSSPPPRARAPATPALIGHGTPTLIISDTVLGHGTNNTIVFEGTFQGRAVAVKRYHKDLIHLATHEVSILQESDDHPNVIRYFYHDQESDPKFFYIVLDLCPVSLADAIENLESDVEVVDKRREEWKDIARYFDERKAMKQIASGLRHLHGLGLIHRDIKPQNILISSPPSSRGPYRMLISDFGLCKKIDIASDKSKFLSTMYGSIAQGTAGWMAPELLQCMDDELELLATSGETTMSSLATIINGSSSESGTSTTAYQCLTKSVDIFALGCLFYYILTRGGHPYGDRFDREFNIKNGIKDLSLLHSNEEAHDLITRMLHRQPSDRLDIKTCLLHPFFWDPAKRLAFLRDASDRIEIMSKDPMDSVLIRLERDAKSIIKTDWHQTLDQSQDQVLIKNLRKSRKYDGNSLRDLLRVLRNKRNHYQDLPDYHKVQLGSMPEGFLEYFTSRYPRLLVYVHEVVKETGLHSESMFRTYFELPES